MSLLRSFLFVLGNVCVPHLFLLLFVIHCVLVFSFFYQQYFEEVENIELLIHCSQTDVDCLKTTLSL